ncbi:hypothetical protein IF1G_00522 [Cordyceps javanica]|uniref:Uncharacterized protein n=1 Tax=Cordyceps javanica TaxID=43265 RepID=A0A545VFW1_9HYPO|nr:hypothetical protein IF1G_00522 [Cordyceps javanica]
MNHHASIDGTCVYATFLSRIQLASMTLAFRGQRGRDSDDPNYVTSDSVQSTTTMAQTTGKAVGTIAFWQTDTRVNKTLGDSSW